MLFLCGFANARAMDEQTNVQSAFLQGMTAMAEAATRAATAAERALERTTGATGGSGSTDGLSAASRILKSPDVYSGDDPMLFQQWKQQFTSWLCFGDSRYVEALEALEKKPEAPPLTAYNADEGGIESEALCCFDLLPERTLCSLGAVGVQAQRWIQVVAYTLP